MNRKGIILSGGTGSRLFPITKVVSKQLIPVFDKPMIYYPLSTLMSIGIRDFLVITTPKDLNQFKNLLEDGRQWGISISYAIQKQPKGIAEALIIGEEFINGSNVVLILGDNIFHGHNLSNRLTKLSNEEGISTILAYQVKNPSDYGIINFDNKFNPINLEEKPKNPLSNYAITGMYFFDEDVSKYAKTISPSNRNELEITDLNKIYLKKNKLNIFFLDRGDVWLDAGTHVSLMQASQYVQTIEERQGLKISCPEEIAWRLKLISKLELKNLALKYKNNDYGEYLLNLIK